MLTARGLQVDDASEPLGLDNARPRFSWLPEAAGSVASASQASYQIQLCAAGAGAAKNDSEEGADLLWDTRRVASPESRDIAYGGAPLVSATAYCWRVRLWGADGAAAAEPGPWSEWARFTSGILSAAEWTAAWIGRGPVREPQLDFDAIGEELGGAARVEAVHGEIAVDATSTLLRREFVIDGPLRRATVFVCGLGFYYLHVNGERLTGTSHRPAKTDYRQYVIYEGYDLTERLVEGANAMGLVLGNGWYNPMKRFWDWHMQWHGSKRAIVQLHLEYMDGRRVCVGSDGTWQTSSGPVREHCLFDGERYDARLEQPGWDRPAFAATDWLPANCVEAPGGRLCHDAMEPIRVTETLRPRRMWEASPGVFLFDLGQNISGVVRLRVQGLRGTEVQIRHGENIYPDGRLDPRTNNYAHNCDRYILRGGAAEVHEPHFVYHGFRYVELRGYPGIPSLDSVAGCVLHTDCAQTGEFRCSDEALNHLHHCTVWSTRANMMGFPTDTNQRDERLGWLADGHLAAEQCLLGFQATRFYRKWLRDMKESQDPATGSIPYIVPRPYTTLGEGSPVWSSAYPLVLWYLYEHTGDTSLIGEHLDAVARYCDYLSGLAEAHILPPDRYGDHLSIADGFQRQQPEHLSTAYYYQDLCLLSPMARIIGQEDRADRYAGLADEVRNAFNGRFLNAAKVCYGAATQCDQLAPLAFDLVPPADRPRVLASVIDTITRKNEGTLRVGIIGAKVAIDLFTAEERQDLIWRWVTRTEYPSLIHMTTGQTTLSETWQRSGTNNHVMWGNIVTWFYRGLAGIRMVPGAVGYRQIRIQPYLPADLQWTRAAVQTPRGRVASAWRREGTQVHFDLTIPANTDAEFRLPIASLADGRLSTNGSRWVWHDGYIPGVSGVIAAHLDGPQLVLQLTPGRHHFRCQWRAGAPESHPAAAAAAVAGQSAAPSPWRSPAPATWWVSALQPSQPLSSLPSASLAEPLGWRRHTSTPFFDLHALAGDVDGILYVANRFHVAQRGEWTLHLGHDGGIRVDLDGHTLATEPDCIGPATESRTTITMALEAGEHELRIAFDTAGGRGWGFFANWEIPLATRPRLHHPTFPVPLDGEEL